MTAPKTTKVSVRLKDNRLSQRYRAGIRVTINEVNVDVDDTQLDALKNDPYIVVSDPNEVPESSEDDTNDTSEQDGDGNDTSDQTPADDGEDDGEEGDKTPEPTQTPEQMKKALLKNNLDTLRKMADEKGVTFGEDSTKAQLADLIIAVDTQE